MAATWKTRRTDPAFRAHVSRMQVGALGFDFGRSTRDSGTYRFKAQWGAKQVLLYWCCILRPGDEIPDLRPESPRYRLVATLWRRRPLSLACLIGPRTIARLS